jgi:hypothetical protein
MSPVHRHPPIALRLLSAEQYNLAVSLAIVSLRITTSSNSDLARSELSFGPEDPGRFRSRWSL